MGSEIFFKSLKFMLTKSKLCYIMYMPLTKKHNILCFLYNISKIKNEGRVQTYENYQAKRRRRKF